MRQPPQDCFPADVLVVLQRPVLELGVQGSFMPALMPLLSVATISSCGSPAAAEAVWRRSSTTVRSIQPLANHVAHLHSVASLSVILREPFRC